MDEDHCSELYDLTSDPKELHNVYSDPKYAVVQAGLQRKLFTWYMQTSDVTLWVEDQRGGGLPWPHRSTANVPISTDSPNEEFAVDFDGQDTTEGVSFHAN
jgi:hypothetical protein